MIKQELFQTKSTYYISQNYDIFISVGMNYNTELVKVFDFGKLKFKNAKLPNIVYIGDKTFGEILRDYYLLIHEQKDLITNRNIRVKVFNNIKILEKNFIEVLI